MGLGGIFTYFVRHKTVANLLLLVMLVAGTVSYPQMRAQFFPDVVVDDVSISVRWDGASAEDVDEGIVQVLEPSLLAVNGVTASSARSTEGRAVITLEFEPDTEIDRAAEDVQLVIDSTAGLPNDAEDPSIRSGGWSDRVTDVVIKGPGGIDQLGNFADELVTRLFAKGVTQTVISGFADPSIVVELPSLSLIQHDISMAEVAAKIAGEATADPAGDVSGSTRVRTGVAKRAAKDIEAIVLRSDLGGTSLTIGDVARVRVETADREAAYFVGDEPAIQLRVNRNAAGDAIEIQQTVEDVVAAMEPTLPAGTTITLTNTLAEVITARLDILLDNGALGMVLVIMLLFLFLNARTAFWVAAGIPAAMLAALALMYIFGITINMISLFALIITLGIVVDDAIVVGEHADYRYRNLGEGPATAAERAAMRMFSPVFSATLTTVIAFFGLMIIGGRFGTLIADIPHTVIVVLLASLVECFLILPHHLSKSMIAGDKEYWYDWPSRKVNAGFDRFKEAIFRPAMNFVLSARYPILALVIFLLASQIALLVRGDVSWRFFNAPERGQITGNFAMLPNASRSDTQDMLKEMQRVTEELGAEYTERYGDNPITFAVGQIGGNAGRGLTGAAQKDSDLLGSISISLVDADLREVTSREFVSDLQERVVQNPLTETLSFRSWGRGPGGDSLSIDLSGADTDTLKAAAEALKNELAQFSEISGLEDSLAYDKEELILELTARGKALGLDIGELGRELGNRLGGIEAASYPVGGRSATISVRIPEDELTADFLERTLIRSSSGSYVPLADVVSVKRRTGFSVVQRENGILLVTVSGDLDDENADRATEIQKVIDETILPSISQEHGVTTALSGQREQEREFLNDARTGLILVLIGIYFALSWVFSSWTRPIIVMAIIPFGLVGAIFGHYAWGIPMSMFSIVGLIGMVGIIINDSIVLVTTIDEEAKEKPMMSAIVDGAVTRLRPVLLTTLTTVFGLMPLLYEGSSQAEFLKPTIITLVYGLAFGMVLVLVVVPTLMAMQLDWSIQLRSAKRALKAYHKSSSRPIVVAAGIALILLLSLILPILLSGVALSGILPSRLPMAALVSAALLGCALCVIYAVIWSQRRRRK